jgi:transglutaminase-like putative cysteine protease
MTVFWQIPRNCLAWILLSQLALIIPHFERLPWWVLFVYCTSAGWRIMVFQGRWSFPSKIAKVIFSLLCFLGIWQSYGTFIGLEPTVALLFSGFCLKLLELVNKRDVYVIIFLGFFVALTEFIFTQEFFITVYIFFVVLLLSTSLVALHQHSYDRFSFVSFKKASVILLQAVPIMLVLFVVFPRFGPLWKVPLPSHQATSGINDTLTPGDISNLSQSGDLAFRVVFDGSIPKRQNMYWRGLVMTNFDGRTWRQAGWAKSFMTEHETDEILKLQNDPLRYTVIQEATYQPWLFSLALAYNDDPTINLASDYRLVRKEDVTSRIKYQVISTPAAPKGLLLSDRTRRVETQLPQTGNPQSRDYAKRLFSGSTDTRDYIQKILSKFSTEEYFYTLKPPALGEHSVDEFLFTTRKGFCSHYASSFVFLMRAAGIPARVVAGYQGGEINPITGTVLVHQFDAHSWAEVWLDDVGWERVDPTAAVSPLRIEFGLERAMATEGSFLQDSPLSPMRYRNVQWLNKIRLQLDAFNFYWSSWVLQYKDQRQSQFLQAMLGSVTPWRVATFMLSIIGALLLVVAYTLLKGRNKSVLTAEVKSYYRLCRRLKKAGYERFEYEGAIDYARRVAENIPSLKIPLMAATNAFVAVSYEPHSPAEKQLLLNELQQEIKKINTVLRRKINIK